MLFGISMTDAAAMFGVSSTVIARRNRPHVQREEEREAIAA